jgi:hypothetical protein
VKRESDQSGSSGLEFRSLATLIGGIILVILLAPPFTWAALVLGVAISIGLFVYGRVLQQHLWMLASVARPRDVGFFDLLDGLEFAILSVLGTVLFIGLNLLIWRWVQNQGAQGLIYLYLVVLGSVVLSVFRDFARLRLGPVTTALGVSWLCCVIWVGFELA